MLTQTATPTRLEAPQWVVWRCPNCNRILAKVQLSAGSAVEVKCHSCNRVAVREAA